MKSTQHMSETELRGEISVLRTKKPLSISEDARFHELQLQITQRITHRYSRIRPEELRVQLVRLQRQREKATELITRLQIEDELRLALQVAQLRGIQLINDPLSRRVTRRELHFHSMPEERLKRTLTRVGKATKFYKQALAVAIARGIQVDGGQS